MPDRVTAQVARRTKGGTGNDEVKEQRGVRSGARKGTGTRGMGRRG